MHAAWAENRRSWKPPRCRKTVTQASWKQCGGMSHNWSAAMDAYKLFRRDQQGRGGRGVVLNAGECLSCFKMFNYSDDKVECLWVRIWWKANKAENPGGSLLQNTQQGSRGRWNTLLAAGRSVTIPSPHSPGGLQLSRKYNTAERKQSMRLDFSSLNNSMFLW